MSTDNDYLNSCKPITCPICGRVVGIREFNELLLTEGRTYYYRHLPVHFCENCLCERNGVETICNIIEADEATREKVHLDREKLLDERRRHSATFTLIGLAGVILLTVGGAMTSLPRYYSTAQTIGGILVLLGGFILWGAIVASRGSHK